METRLPVYLNADEATLVFARQAPSDVFDLRIEFVEKDTGQVPAQALNLSLSGEALTHRQSVDISGWPDGEYLVRVMESDDQNQALVRAIRKQTIEKPRPPQKPHHVEGRKMFFVDDWYIEESSGLKFSVKPAETIPIDLSRIEATQGAVSGGIRRFWFSEEGHLYAEISLRYERRGRVVNHWVVSEDMETWETVDEPARMSSEFTVTDLRDQEPSLNEPAVPHRDREYRFYDPESDGPVRLNEVVVQYSGLEQNVEWSGIPIPHRSRIAVWVRPDGEALILGGPITQDKLEWDDDDVGDWRDSNDNFGRPRLTADGSRLRAFQSRRVPRNDPFRVYYDNMLSDRIMVTWTTGDGMNWTPMYFDAPTNEDPWATQHYGVDLWWEEDGNLEFAYHRIYDVQMQRVYTELVYSRDGFHWNRFEHDNPFLTNGPRSEWNFGYAITPPSGIAKRAEYRGEYFEPMVGINVLHFMFLAAHYRDDRSVIDTDFYARRLGGRMVGPNGVENSPIMQWYDSWEDIVDHTRQMRFTPALMRYRQEGWVAVEPLKRRGEFTTKPLRGGSELVINARTSDDGFVMVELLDEWGNPMPGYSGPDAAFFSGDFTGAVLEWGSEVGRDMPQGDIRLRVTLEKAELYTFQF